MNGVKKSDGAIVPSKRANNGVRAFAEPVEERASTKGNPRSESTRRTQCRESVTQAAERIRQAATRKPREKLTALLHHVTPDALRWAFHALKRDAAAGVDGMTWAEYAEGLEERLLDLHRRVQTGAYRAPPVRRVRIPKPDGGTRPLGVAALEDKIVQKAVTEIVLTPIYEPAFLGFSYGFRPGRGAHDALDALAVAITRRKVNWVVDCDIRAFFDSVSRDWLVRFLEHRIGDKRVIRLIVKWLKAGVMEDGQWQDSPRGTPQGATASPMLANVYLHYVLDLWFHRKWRPERAEGDAVIVRYADDAVVGFEHKRDAERFLHALGERLGRFDLALHPDKILFSSSATRSGPAPKKARCAPRLRGGVSSRIALASPASARALFSQPSPAAPGSRRPCTTSLADPRNAPTRSRSAAQRASRPVTAATVRRIGSESASLAPSERARSISAP